jgi:hypothetical protein
VKEFQQMEQMEEWYKTKHCRNWDDFLRKVRGLPKRMFYRGQSDNKLKSSFECAVDASQPLIRKRWLYEAALLREFRRRAHHYIPDTPDHDDLLEWLALMRHYGAPTRLVDFTYSHYIAAYFAFSDLDPECKDRAIWAINSKWLDDESRKRCSEMLVGLRPSKIDLHLPEHFTRCFLDPNRKAGSSRCFVSAVNAERMNKRLTIQQGFFLCPGDIERSFEENLSNMVSKESSQKTIVKFVIPHSARNEALTELKHMNISRATLFPDLGGLAESMNDRFELLFKDYPVSRQTLKTVVTWKKTNN